MTAPLELPTDAAPEAVLEGVGGEAIQGRSLGQIAWMRLRRDKVAMAGGAVIIFLILVPIFGPFLKALPQAVQYPASAAWAATKTQIQQTIGTAITGDPSKVLGTIQQTATKNS